MVNRVDLIARAIFEWLDGPEVRDDRGNTQPPYAFNSNIKALTITIDGALDCRLLAEAIDKKLSAEKPASSP